MAPTEHATSPPPHRSTSIRDGLISPDWPAPSRVNAVSTTRAGGFSEPPYDTLNLGQNCGDQPQVVQRNRDLLAATLGLTLAPAWLNQIHGTNVVNVGEANRPKIGNVPTADASVTKLPGQALAILSADCLPVLLCDRSGTFVGAAHAGWRGLSAGILEQVCKSMPGLNNGLLAWIGPAISQRAYEVGEEVRAAFVDDARELDAYFQATGDRPGKWLADLPGIARARLNDLGVGGVWAANACTVSNSHKFFSHRRAAPTGRQASLIWLSTE